MLDKVRSNMKKFNLDTLWISDLNSIEFLSGYLVDVGERFIGLVITQDRATIVLNHLFEYVGHKEIDVEYYYDFDDVHNIIKKYTVGPRVGLDKEMRAQFVLPLISDEFKLVIGSQCVDSLRAIKNKNEIQRMIEASQINDKVMEQVPQLLHVGVSECEVADKIKELFHQHGATLSFETIVAFGDHGADPHAIPSDRRLKENESIIIDMGCKYNGYCSDMTRTFFINHNPIKDVYDTVLMANLKAIESIEAGQRFCDIDKVARDIITNKGYGINFNHRLGHGIGKQVHEPFDVSLSNTALIEPGMCFSIEPGIYVKNEFGIRIEDLVYVNEEGKAVLLNHYPKNHEIIF